MLKATTLINDLTNGILFVTESFIIGLIFIKLR